MPSSILELHPQKILIRSTNWIGDAIITTPAVRTIRQNFPEARISILALPWVADVFKASPYVDEVILYQKKKEHQGLPGMWRLAAELAERRFDLAILLQNAFVAAVIAKLAEIPARAGYTTDGRGLLLTHGVRLRKEVKKIHQVNYYQEMLKGLGLTPGSNELFLNLPEDDVVWAKRIVADFGPRPLIGFNPGAAYGPAKCWPVAHFRELATLLAHEFAATLVVFGTSADIKAAAEIAEGAPGRVLDLTGKTNLSQAMAMIGICDAFVTNDSGLMHVGAALKTPLVAIFGSTNSVATGPYSDNATVIQKDLACRPCYKTHCKTGFSCMLEISAREVFSAVQKILSDKNWNEKGTKP